MDSTDQVGGKQPQDTEEGGKQPEDVRKDDTKSPLMDLYSCNHDIALALKEKLVDREACPACLVNYHIKVNEDLQDVLDKRGGIFLSKTSDPADVSIIPHKDCIRLWTVIKIECYQDISLLETICRDDPQQGEEWGIPEALQRWNQAHLDLTSVPGCHNAIQGEFEASKTSGPGPDLRVGQLADVRETSEHIENVDTQQQEVSLQNKTNTPHSTTESPKDQDDISPKSGVPHDEREVTEQVNRSQSLEDWVMFDAAVNFSTLPDAPLAPSSPPATPDPRSALKGSRPSTPTSRPRTSFAEQTTIIAPNFRYSGSTDHKPHNTHTSAETARRQTHFHRPSATYEPATWSSPEGHEKDNTSHYKTSWYKYETVMEIGKWAKQAPASRRSSSWNTMVLADKVKETEAWLLAKNREKAKRREAFAAKHGDGWEERLEELRERQKRMKLEQGESNTALECRTGGETDEAVALEESAGGQRYAALDAWVGEPQSER